MGEVEIRQPFTKELTKLHKKDILRTRITRQTMDFKSTIFIFGVALIFILPLVISSPLSGVGINQKKRAIDLEEAFGEEAKERVKRGGKLPGSKGYVRENGNGRKFKGGKADEWHLHDEGKHPHIKLANIRKITLDQNNPKTNKLRAKEALEALDALYEEGHKIPNYVQLRKEIDDIAKPVMFA